MTRRSRLRADTYRILSDAVEAGVARGLRRAWKYSEDPPPSEERLEAIAEHVAREVLAEACEFFRFD